MMTEDVMTLYLASFPAEERRPLHQLSRLVADPSAPVTLYRAELDGCFAAFLTLWRLPSGLHYVEHFAVIPTLRGRGAGSEIVTRLPELAGGSPVVIEVERPCYEESRRRIAFYSRGGFVLHEGFDYVQPPYSRSRAAVGMLLMTLGAPGSLGVEDIARELHEQVYQSTLTPRHET